MYAIVVNDEKELLKFAKEKGLKVFKLENGDFDNLDSVNVKPSPAYTNISEFLFSLGLKPHIKGFKYLKYIFENGLTCEGGITKVLYPKIAVAFDTTPSRVERAIRHSIESVVYDHKLLNKYFEMFGNFDSCPTNLQFIEGCNLHLENLAKK